MLFVLTSNVQILREGTNPAAVKERSYFELGTLGTRESIHSSISSVLVVGCFGFNVALLGTRDSHLEFVTTECLGVSSLVLGLNGEAEDAEAGVTGISTLDTLDFPGRVLDGLALQINSDFIWARLSGIEDNVIGTISVVGYVGVYITMGSLDLDVK